ncbi:MAG: signal peptidase II [Deinococcales bacterium]
MFVLVIFLIILDQVTKIWAVNTFPPGTPEMKIGLGFHFTHIKNTGAAFGIFQNATLILAVLSAIVSLFLIIYLINKRRELDFLTRLALSLILAGAIGNMIDRFRLRYVNDFIHFHLPNFDFPVFNVADSCVVIGAGLLILGSFLMPQGQKSPKTADQGHGSDPLYPSSGGLERSANETTQDPTNMLAAGLVTGLTAAAVVEANQTKGPYDSDDLRAGFEDVSGDSGGDGGSSSK